LTNTPILPRAMGSGATSAGGHFLNTAPTAAATANPLSLASIEKDGSIRLAAGSDITGVNASAGAVNPLERLLGPGWAGYRVLLDLRRTTFIDSAGIGWLLSSQQQFRMKGGSLVVHSVGPRVRQILDLLRVGKAVPLAADETAARAMLAAVADGHTSQTQQQGKSSSSPQHGFPVEGK
jgi:anti-anti-sigma factor